MKFLMYFSYFLLGIMCTGFAWMWVASLITHFCNQWWSRREAYRKKMDKDVVAMVRDLDDMEQIH